MLMNVATSTELKLYYDCSHQHIAHTLLFGIIPCVMQYCQLDCIFTSVVGGHVERLILFQVIEVNPYLCR